MDPISIQLLTSLACGAGGQLGAAVWSSLSELVRRRFRGGEATDGSELDAPAVDELTALEQAPQDPARAHALSTALAVRSALDPGFAAELRDWIRQAEAVVLVDNGVHNTVSGGTQTTVVQGRDFGSISFTSNSPHPPVRPTDS